MPAGPIPAAVLPYKGYKKYGGAFICKKNL
nr:MAG TPA: hypothetical protein [Bacteriophage sp.]